MRFDEWMSANDAILWHIERDPTLRSTITTVWFLDRMPEPDRLHATLASAPVLAPRLAQRVEADPLALAPPRWVDDAGFDVDEHIEHVVLDGDHDDAAVLELAAHIHEQPFDKARPPWDCHVVEGLRDGRAAMIVRAHHAIGDGLGLVQMIGAFVDLEPDPESRPAFAPPDFRPTAPGPLDALLHRMRSDLSLARRMSGAVVKAAAGSALDPIGSARRTASTAASIAHLLEPVRTPRSPVMTGRSVDVAFRRLERPTTLLLETARALGASLNDVFVAAVAEAVHRYHLAHGAELDDLRLTMPISVRAGETADLAGNRFVPARFVIPVGRAEPVDRVAQLRGVLAAERAEPALPHLDDVSEMINRAGPVAATALLGSMLKAVDLVVSNVPGPGFPMYAAGARIERLVPFGPCAGAACNVTLLSYDGTASIGITADRAAVSEPDLVATALGDALDAIVAAAAAA